MSRLVPRRFAATPLCRITLAAALAGAFSFVALSVAPPQQQPPQPPQQQPPQPPRTPEDDARRAKVIAKVHETTITVGDVEDAVNAQSPFLRARYRDPAVLQEFVS